MQAWRGKLQLLHFYFFLCGTKCSAFGWDFSKYKTFRVWATDLVVLHSGQRHLDHVSDTPCWFILWNNQFIYCSPYIFRSSFQDSPSSDCLSFLLPLAINPIIWTHFCLPAHNGLCAQLHQWWWVCSALAVLGRALRQKLWRFGEHLQITLSK